MIILFILGLLLGGVSVVFALPNVEVITVNFFSWQLTGSLALILSMAILAGALVVILILLPESIKNAFRYRSLKKENAKLEDELRKQKELAVFAKNAPMTEKELSNIQNGAIAHN